MVFSSLADKIILQGENMGKDNQECCGGNCGCHPKQPQMVYINADKIQSVEDIKIIFKYLNIGVVKDSPAYRDIKHLIDE